MNEGDTEGIENEVIEENINDSSEDAETLHWIAVIRCFMCYKYYSNQLFDYKKSRMASLSVDYKKLLPKSVLNPFSHHAILGMECNHYFCEAIVRCQYLSLLGPPVSTSVSLEGISDRDITGIPVSMLERCKAVLHSAYREWSKEAEEERNQCHTPILQQLAKWLPITSKNKYKLRVSVPGSGLARLAAEICSRGYRVQANEYSVFMLMASNYILNNCHRQQEIYPWVGSTVNVKRVEDANQSVLVPDINPGELIYPHDAGDLNPVFSVAAGDFVQLYGPASPCGSWHKGKWSAVVTCFFIDTAPNVIDYVKTIHHMLEDGGIWVNLGPLQYHWASEVAPTSASESSDSRYERSIELSFEDILEVLQNAGFELLEQSWHQCSYALDRNCMRQTIYNCGLFTVRKIKHDP